MLQAKRVKNVMDQACLCTYAHHVPFMNHTPYRNMHTWILYLIMHQINVDAHCSDALCGTVQIRLYIEGGCRSCKAKLEVC